MPNIIRELSYDLSRLEKMLPSMNEEEQRKARDVIEYGRRAITAGQYEEMSEALHEVQEFLGS